MNKYILSPTNNFELNNAGGKATFDAITTAKALGYKYVSLYYNTQLNTKISHIIKGIYNTKVLCKSLNSGDVILIQYPLNRILLKRILKTIRSSNKDVAIIMMIHDIDYLRDVTVGKRTIEEMKELELNILNQADYIICHNEKMIDVLHNESVSAQLINMKIFDYLYSGKDAVVSSIYNQVVIAGNLDERKVGYLYKLDDKFTLDLMLYGSQLNLEKLNCENATYKGSFAPDKLIENLEGRYGLVWDGNDLHRCGGSYGKYLKINCPHKLSLYIAAGLPVIVWRESAMSKFVEEENIGFSIGSIDKLEKALKENEINYSMYTANISKVKFNLRNGMYLKEALNKIEVSIKEIKHKNTNGK
ncbi:MAG: hypothetical protein R3Y45_05365 [Bacillota bacterium]